MKNYLIVSIVFLVCMNIGLIFFINYSKKNTAIVTKDIDLSYSINGKHIPAEKYISEKVCIYIDNQMCSKCILKYIDFIESARQNTNIVPVFLTNSIDSEIIELLNYKNINYIKTDKLIDIKLSAPLIFVSIDNIIQFSFTNEEMDMNLLSQYIEIIAKKGIV